MYAQFEMEKCPRATVRGEVTMPQGGVTTPPVLLCNFTPICHNVVHPASLQPTAGQDPFAQPKFFDFEGGRMTLLSRSIRLC